MTPVARYHPVLVALHWTLALLIVATLIYGFVWMGNLPTSDPTLLPVLRLHVLGGLVILGLMSWRLHVRLTRPGPAAGRGLPARIAVVSHYGFYLLVGAIVLTGLMTIVAAGLVPAILWGGQGVMPHSFEALPIFIVHALLVTLLSNLILLHLIAALYHQFIRKDGVFRRMSLPPDRNGP